MKINFDVDIDVANRDMVLEHLRHIPAKAKNTKNSKHQSGVYLQDIPLDPFLGVSVIDYKDAEEMGFFKLDVLNNSVYDDFKSNEEVDEMMREPQWEWFENTEIVTQLSHVNKHAGLLKRYAPKSVIELAMVIAMIRPAKKHLVGEPFDVVEKTIWDKPADGEYYYKKAHAVSYAMMIVVELNRMMSN